MKTKYIKPEATIISISVDTSIMNTSTGINISDENHEGGPANVKKRRNSFWDETPEY